MQIFSFAFSAVLSHKKGPSVEEPYFIKSGGPNWT